MSTGEDASSPPDIDNRVEGDDEGDLSISKEDARIVVSKNDRSLAELYRWFGLGKLVVDPEWQREYVWDKKRASRLIESVLIDIPIPIVYLAETETGKYEVIDGLQRLTSIFSFFADEFSLTGLEILSDLNGKTFKTLSASEQAKLEDSTFRTFELARSTQKDLMFVIFERLNTGGVALNDMEIRNCLYRGPLNSLLKELKSNQDFITCLNMTNLSKRMLDRALVLRFLAFYERTPSKARNGLKQFLNEFMTTYRNPSAAKIKEFKAVFAKCMKASHTIFGTNGFRLPKNIEAGGGEWASRPNAAIFQAVSVPLAQYDLGQITRSADAIYEEYIDLVHTDPKWTSAVAKSTGDYMSLDYAFRTWSERLALAVSNAEPNAKNRVFSRGLKREMFASKNVCASCGQEIKTLDDAVLDHDRHYWRGGLTVPSNANLMHRHCNLVKGGR